VTKIQRLQVRVFQDLEELSRVAAELITELSKKSIASRGRFVIALSGGSTPQRLYSLLGSPLYRDVIDWSRMYIFWTDERCVPKDHAASNYKLAHDAFLSRVPLPAKNIHRIRGEDEPNKAAEAYQDELLDFFSGPGAIVFDLIILGVGEDGHTASLFPGSHALDERMRPVVPIYLLEPKINRVTLTLPVLNHAAQVLFLVSGRSKAAAVHEIVEDGNPKQYPAGLVRPLQGSIVWMIDQDASSALTKRLHASLLNERG
jgi:6-phosphogluconolactonase